MRGLKRGLLCGIKVCFIAAVMQLPLHSAQAISFDEAEMLDKVDGGELLSRARDAANSGQFSSARSFINQARSKGAAPAQVKAAETLLANAEAKAEVARRKEEARVQAAAAAATAASASSQAGSVPRGNAKEWISVEARCVTGGYCIVKDLSISGPGEFSSHYNRAGSGAIRKGSGDGLVGQYRYSYLIETSARSCVASGSFTVDGTQGNIEIGHFPPSLNCGFAKFLEY